MQCQVFLCLEIGYITEKYDYLLFPVAQNLQNIIQEQIQNLSSGTSMLPAMAASTVPTASTVASSSSTTSMVPTSTVAPRAPPQAQPSYSVVPGSITAPTAAPTATSAAAAASAASTLNSNAQAALMILLTAQMQSQSGEPSLLQNPQVVSVLQNLVNNAGGGSSAEDQKQQPSVDLNDLMKDPSLASVFRPAAAATNVNGLSAAMTAAAAASRPALLDTPKSRPILLNNPPTAPPQTSNTQNEATAASVTNNLNNLLNTQNLNQLLGSLTGSGGSTATSAEPQPTSANPSTVASGGVHPQPPAPQQQALLGAIPTSLASNGLYQQHHQNPATNSQRPVLYDGTTGQSLLGFPYQNPAAVAHAAANAATSAVTANGHHPQQTAAHAAFYIQQQPSQQQLYQQQAQLFGLQGFTAAAPPPPPSHPHQPAMTMSNPQAAFLNPNSMTFATPASMAMAMTPSSIMNSIQHVPTLTAASGYHYNQHGAIGTPVMTPSTPVGHGLKRKISIPPSPEQSPEGPYIGQHSQGLGGHYASSYLSKKAKY